MNPRERIPKKEYSKDHEVEDAAWGYFIRAINAVTPEVFESLREDVLPVWLDDKRQVVETDPWNPGDPVHTSLPSEFARNTLSSWARKHNLELKPLIDATELALDQYLDRRPAVIEVKSDWNRIRRFDSLFWERFFDSSGVREIILDPPVLSLSWNPHRTTRLEARAEFIAEIDRYLDDLEDLAEHKGLTRTPEKRSDKGDILDHFKWLALVLIRGESWYGLEKATGKSRQTIKGGVRAACKLTRIPVETVGLPPE